MGWLFSAIAIGSVVAGLTSGWIGRVRRQGVALIVAVFVWGRRGGRRGTGPRLWLVVLLLAVGGAADLVSAVYRQTMLLTYAPDEMRGRMQGVFTAVVAGGPRLGDLRAGLMARPGAHRGLGRRWTRRGGGRAAARRRVPGVAAVHRAVTRPYIVTAWNRTASLRRTVDDRIRGPRGRRGRGRRRPARAYARAALTFSTGTPVDEICPVSAGQVLAPWPNRIRDGRYTFGGEVHQLALTEPARHNAIHGLVNWERWRLVEPVPADR